MYQTEQAQPKFNNIFKFLSFILPHAIVSFFVLLSLFNQNLKVIFYLFGLLFMNIIINIAQISGIQGVNRHQICSIFDTGLSLVDVPSYSVASIAYTIAYLFVPMIMFNVLNIMVLGSLFLALCIISYFQTNYGCLTTTGIIYGVFIGLLIGTITVFVTSTINRDYLYYSEYISDKVACTIPEKQTF